MAGMDLPLGEIAVFALAVALSGVVSGLMAGVFGIGGGAVLVPVFYQVFGLLGVEEAVRMHLSVGSSLAIIIPTSLRSFTSHKARGAVDMELLRSFYVPIPVGVVLASLTAALISSEGLRIIFAVITLLVAFRLLFNRESWRIGTEIPGNPARGVIGVLIGYFSTLMGIGGGVMNNTFMTLYGRPIHQAVATSSGTGVLISIPGVIGMMWAGWGEPNLPAFSLGYVNILGVALIIPITTFAAPFGVKIAHALPRRYLEIFFGLFLLSVAARFAWSLWG